MLSEIDIGATSGKYDGLQRALMRMLAQNFKKIGLRAPTQLWPIFFKFCANIRINVICNVICNAHVAA
jgi:hypothetical protein